MDPFQIPEIIGQGIMALTVLSPSYVLFRFIVFPLLDHEPEKHEYLEAENINHGFFDGGAPTCELVKAAIRKEVQLREDL